MNDNEGLLLSIKGAKKPHENDRDSIYTKIEARSSWGDCSIVIPKKRFRKLMRMPYRYNNLAVMNYITNQLLHKYPHSKDALFIDS